MRKNWWRRLPRIPIRITPPHGQWMDDHEEQK